MVFVNGMVGLNPRIPLEGINRSGHGREQSPTRVAR